MPVMRDSVMPTGEESDLRKVQGRLCFVWRESKLLTHTVDSI
jgi:hypothetical protein